MIVKLTKKKWNRLKKNHCFSTGFIRQSGWKMKSCRICFCYIFMLFTLYFCLLITCKCAFWFKKEEDLHTQEQDDESAKQIQPDIVMMDRYQGEVTELEKKISTEGAKLSGGGIRTYFYLGNYVITRIVKKYRCLFLKFSI